MARSVSAVSLIMASPSDDLSDFFDSTVAMTSRVEGAREEWSELGFSQS
jgi:hypothetical protein